MLQQNTKSPDCINQEPEENLKKKKDPKRIRKILGEVFFYLFLILMLLGLLLYKNNNGKPRVIAGYSCFFVLSSSMEEEIPKGSFVVTKKVPAEELKVGDNITYLNTQTSTITHRIIGIHEDYQRSGKRAFETKGIMNKAPDEKLVPQANVIGKVIFHNYAIGQVLNFLSRFWHYILILMFLIFGFIKALKIALQKNE